MTGNQDSNLLLIKKEWHGSFKAYLIGFIISLVLTLLAFTFVYTEVFSGNTMLFILSGLGLIQAIFQVFYFLHLGKEEAPKWETMIFLFMVMVLLVIVLGSLWIMFDLDKRVMGDMML